MPGDLTMLNYGGSYAKLGVFMTEVSGGIDAYTKRCGGKDYGTIMRCALGLAGKVMGYSGLGIVAATRIVIQRPPPLLLADIFLALRQSPTRVARLVPVVHEVL